MTTDYARSEWARIDSRWSDPLRAPLTDAEPIDQDGADLLAGAVQLGALWVYATAAVLAALAIVIAILGLAALRAALGEETPHD